MKLYDHERNEIDEAMRERRLLKHTRGNVTILVDEGGGPWRQPMICGAVVVLPSLTARKWCRTLQELEEFLEEYK